MYMRFFNCDFALPTTQCRVKRPENLIACIDFVVIYRKINSHIILSSYIDTQWSYNLIDFCGRLLFFKFE